MALPTPKAAVQIARLARATVHGTAHETQRVVKARLQLWGHDIVTQRLFRTVYTLGEPQNEVTPLHMLRDIDEFFDESCHWLLVKFLHVDGLHGVSRLVISVSGEQLVQCFFPPDIAVTDKSLDLQSSIT